MTDTIRLHRTAAPKVQAPAPTRDRPIHPLDVYRVLMNTPMNRDALTIIKVARRLAALCGAFDAEYDSESLCQAIRDKGLVAFDRHTDAASEMLTDVAGVKWAIELFIGSIGCAVWDPKIVAAIEADLLKLKLTTD